MTDDQLDKAYFLKREMIAIEQKIERFEKVDSDITIEFQCRTTTITFDVLKKLSGFDEKEKENDRRDRFYDRPNGSYAMIAQTMKTMLLATLRQELADLLAEFEKI